MGVPAIWHLVSSRETDGQTDHAVLTFVAIAAAGTTDDKAVVVYYIYVCVCYMQGEL